MLHKALEIQLTKSPVILGINLAIYRSSPVVKSVIPYGWR